MTKFLILIFLTGLFYASSACKLGTFTDTSPCDTKATPIQYKKYTSVSIEAGQWAYYYIPLRGIEDNIELFFKIDGPSPDGFLNFQLKNDDNLPTDSDFYYDFHAREGDQKMPAPRKVNGIKDFDKAIMVLGLKNSGSSKTNVQIAYSVEEDDNDDDENRALKKLITGIIIGVAVAAGLLFCIGGYSMWMVKQLSRRNALGAQNGNRLRIEAARTLQNNKDEDHLSLEDLQKYFPKKPFKDFENPFQQTGCSVCLEDFLPEVSCHQLYCNHIFHETCVEKWLEKHHSCPGCRVSMGKKAIEEFLEKQKKLTEGNCQSIEIKIQSREVVHGQEL